MDAEGLLQTVTDMAGAEGDANEIQQDAAQLTKILDKYSKKTEANGNK